MHNTQMGITNLLIRHHERAMLQEQTVITITENLIRQVYRDENFLDEIVQTARERTLYELTRQRRRQCDDDKHDYNRYHNRDTKRRRRNDN